MVDLDPIHQMRGLRDIAQEPAGETVRRKKRSRAIRLTSYVLFFVFVAIVVFVIVNIRQPKIEHPDLRVVSLEEWEEELKLEGDAIIIDIREAYKYETSRIPGAMWGQRGGCYTYGVDTCDESPCDSRRNWYFYSDHGEDYHEIENAINVTYSRQCWATVYLLEGGFKAWEKAGNKVDAMSVTMKQ